MVAWQNLAVRADFPALASRYMISRAYLTLTFFRGLVLPPPHDCVGG